VSVDFDDETIIYHRQTGEVHRLNSVGSIVWRFLDGSTTVDELITDMAAAFEVDPGVVGGQVGDLLERLGRGFLLAGGPEAELRSKPLLLTNPPSP
jgi:hypothetical protein